MSRSTPRKPRQGANANANANNNNNNNHRHHHHHNHNRHPSAPRIPASDYESDAQHYMETTRPPPPAPELLQRTNTDLNLAVLRRHVPTITTILSIAANAVVYNWANETREWFKDGMEGPVFVCSRESATPNGPPRACVFVLNRRGLDNLTVELDKVQEVEVTEQLLIFRVEREAQTGESGDKDAQTEDEDAQGNGADDDGGGGGDVEGLKVLGLWIHADEDHTRETNGKLIFETWKEVREAAASAAAAARQDFGVGGYEAPTGGYEASAGSYEASAGGYEAPTRGYEAPAGAGPGRQINLNDIFGARNGGPRQ